MFTLWSLYLFHPLLIPTHFLIGVSDKQESKVTLNLFFFFVVPYLVTIVIAIFSIGLWYYRIVYKDALSKSYNAEIRAKGHRELFQDVYQNTEAESSNAVSAEEVLREETCASKP